MKRLIFRTFFNYLVAALFVLFWGPVFLIFLYLPARWRRDNKFLFWWLSLMYRVALAIACPSILFKGRRPQRERPLIFAANHQSSLDVPILGSIVGRKPHIWFVLSWYIRYPLLGRFIKAMGVPVEQDGGRKSASALRQALELICDTNRDLIIFPEGGRFIDEKIHPFRSGVAVIARITKRPVVPVCIHGVHKAYPPASFWFYKAQITVEIGEPLIPRDEESDEQFLARLLQWFSDRF